MEYVAIVTILALLQLFVFAVQVGQQRVKHNVKAPAITGPAEFERAFRVHQNTIEQLIVFLPALWIFATYWRADVAAGRRRPWSQRDARTGALCRLQRC